MTAPLTYSIDAAAERLGGPFTIDWLRGHIDEIPHVKTGRGSGRSGRIGFTEAHLTAIVAMFTVEPAPGTNPGDFTPLTRRRSA